MSQPSTVILNDQNPLAFIGKLKKCSRHILTKEFNLKLSILNAWNIRALMRGDAFKFIQIVKKQMELYLFVQFWVWSSYIFTQLKPLNTPHFTLPERFLSLSLNPNSMVQSLAQSYSNLSLLSPTTRKIRTDRLMTLVTDTSEI